MSHQKMRAELVNQSNNKKPILIGALAGLALSVFLCFTQNNDFTLYLSCAPYYLDSLFFQRDGMVSVTTFVYFIGLFSLMGYLISIKLSKLYLVIFVFLVICIHFILLKMSGDVIFQWMK